MSNRALITGITGQDGSYLSEILLDKGYEVAGIVRRSSNGKNLSRIDHILDKIKLYDGDLLDSSSIEAAINDFKPSEFYNIAAQSFVPLSWSNPIMTTEITGTGVLRCLEAIRKLSPETRFYQSSSSEQFGKVRETPQTEKTPFYPRSPYGVAKAYGHYITVNYRESYGLHASSGICFNHGSSRRGIEFVERKITDGVARIALKKQDVIRLGNLDAKRDWGHSKDFCEAMWLMLQQDTPDDYVIATGETHTVKDLVKIAFDYVGLKWENHVVIDPKFFRPAEVDLLIGDSTKAREKLGWSPRVSFREMVEEMVASDLKALSLNVN